MTEKDTGCQPLSSTHKHRHVCTYQHELLDVYVHVCAHTHRLTKFELGAHSSVLALSLEGHNRLIELASDTNCLNIGSGLCEHLALGVKERREEQVMPLLALRPDTELRLDQIYHVHTVALGL